MTQGVIVVVVKVVMVMMMVMVATIPMAMTVTMAVAVAVVEIVLVSAWILYTMPTITIRFVDLPMLVLVVMLVTMMAVAIAIIHTLIVRLVVVFFGWFTRMRRSRVVVDVSESLATLLSMYQCDRSQTRVCERCVCHGDIEISAPS